MSGRNVIAFSLLCLGLVSRAGSQEPSPPMFSLGGFGTLGVVHSSEEDADFGTSVIVPRGAGFSRQWSPEVDSRVGVQLTGNFSPRLSATVQAVLEQRYDGTYLPRVDWANIRYHLTPQLSIRVGRTTLASFLASDFRKVGYANPWVRPPPEVYGMVLVGSSDGVSASHRLQRGDLVHTLQGSYGQTKASIVGGGVTEGRDQWVFSDTLEYGPATLRIAYQQVHVVHDRLHRLFDAFRQFGSQGNAIADRYDVNGKRVSFIGLGALYDPGKWFAMAEWGTVDFRSVIGERTSWYASVGRRFDNLTPYVTYAEANANSNTSDPGIAIAGMPPQLAGPAAGLNAGLNAVLAANPVQQTVSLGARWDFVKNVALKLQYDHINLGSGSPGNLSNHQAGFVPGGGVDLVSASIDFVW